MSSFCFMCREKSDFESARVANTNIVKLIILSKCAVCDTKKWNFIKEQEASGLLDNLGIKAPLSKIPLVGTLLCLKCI